MHFKNNTKTCPKPRNYLVNGNVILGKIIAVVAGRKISFNQIIYSIAFGCNGTNIYAVFLKIKSLSKCI